MGAFSTKKMVEIIGASVVLPKPGVFGMGKRMDIERISSVEGGAPALGPYSPAVAAGSLVFVSGQTPYDPERGGIYRGTVAEQTQLVLANLEKVLVAAGCTRESVVSCRVYLQDLTTENFQAMNGVYGEFFGAHKPTRTTVGAGLLGMDVEIEAVAVRGA